ncbi:hypothetical protein [Listeria booriae]|uniref:hypothetical protein n=1 Tax=Listeria booriae TaxID=1552123 RepID=UPI001627A014|nr:hypothetical protein [Listeria booriae]MBC2318747.1 hypothetical protein [Listeria booriae]
MEASNKTTLELALENREQFKKLISLIDKDTDTFDKLKNAGYTKTESVKIFYLIHGNSISELIESISI